MTIDELSVKIFIFADVAGIKLNVTAVMSLRQGRELDAFSLDTVKMFHTDAQRVRFSP